MTRAARLLRQGGTLARFWNYEVPDEPAASALEEVYLRLAPRATRFVFPPDRDWLDPVAESGAFSAPETRIYEWARSLSTDEWVNMVSTFSDHQRLEPERLARPAGGARGRHRGPRRHRPRPLRHVHDPRPPVVSAQPARLRSIRSIPAQAICRWQACS
ncbi:MAG TPA: hypothetical protein VIA06_02770 [Candidatus Dormibacteraeota bacterium]|nr:hypothetical protein [Candidatus Dormibacteraeota bacterium]